MKRRRYSSRWPQADDLAEILVVLEGVSHAAGMSGRKLAARALWRAAEEVRRWAEVLELELAWQDPLEPTSADWGDAQAVERIGRALFRTAGMVGTRRPTLRLALLQAWVRMKAWARALERAGKRGEQASAVPPECGEECGSGEVTVIDELVTEEQIRDLGLPPPDEGVEEEPEEDHGSE